MEPLAPGQTEIAQKQSPSSTPISRYRFPPRSSMTRWITSLRDKWLESRQRKIGKHQRKGLFRRLFRRSSLASAIGINTPLIGLEINQTMKGHCQNDRTNSSDFKRACSKQLACLAFQTYWSRI